MGWWEEKLQDAIAAVTRGMSGVKLGPGVLGTIIPINTVGLVVLAAFVWALSSTPLYALIALVLGLAFLVYANERAFRYAIKNPIPALLSGGEILQLYRDQVAARDSSLVVKSDPTVGAGAKAIEHRDGDV
jgi:hypothetical protein